MINNDNEDNPGDQSWELAKLIGRYETFTEGVDRRLDKIEGHLESGSKSFSEINSIMAKRTERINNIEERIEHFENNGISKRRRLQIDGTTITAIILTIKEIVTVLISFFH